MGDPAADYPRPDVEALIWSQVQDLTRVTSWAFIAVPLPAPTGWHVATSVQVDVRGPTKQATYHRANEARRRLLNLPFVEWADGVITAVFIIEDAWWNPDPDGKPRYTARYEVRAHPAPAAERRSA